MSCHQGNDRISTGRGNDFAIGDAGSNSISPSINVPRIYQIYRSFESPQGSGYAPNRTRFGFTFSCDFDLPTNSYRRLDAQGFSFIDTLNNMDDVSKRSNVARDTFEISSIATEGDFFMQPILRFSPGFSTKTNFLNGNDVIISEGGDDILVGDDIKGSTSFDLTNLKAIRDSRQAIDGIVTDISVRLSTLEYDTGYYQKYATSSLLSVGYNISVACDIIVTKEESNAFVVGDYLVLKGRTLQSESFPDPVNQIADALQLIHDVELVLTDLNYALYEVHLELLQRAQRDIEFDYKGDQEPLHRLELGNDKITSNGNDIVVGESTTMYFQVDLPLFEEFGKEFTFDQVGADKLPDLSAIMNDRDTRLSLHIEQDLIPSTPFTNTEATALPFADLPFFTSIGVDEFNLHNNSVVAVGDFAAIGIVYSNSSTDISYLTKYAESVNDLRVKSGVDAINPSLESLGNAYFFYKRYNMQSSKLVEPQLHGDTFVAPSEKNVVFGDFLTAAMFRKSDGSYELGTKIDFFGRFLNLEYASYFDPDTINAPGPTSPIWIGQKSQDIVVGDTTNSKATTEVTLKATDFFENHKVAAQMVSDISRRKIPYSFDSSGIRNINSRSTPQVQPNNCTGSCSLTIQATTYVPSHTKSVYIYSNVTEVEISQRAIGRRALNEVDESPVQKLLRISSDAIKGSKENMISNSVTEMDIHLLRHRKSD